MYSEENATEIQSRQLLAFLCGNLCLKWRENENICGVAAWHVGGWRRSWRRRLGGVAWRGGGSGWRRLARIGVAAAQAAVCMYLSANCIESYWLTSG